MAPPTYGDLGKSSRDVFGKGYHFSLLKLDVKTKTATGVEFNSGYNTNQDSGKKKLKFHEKMYPILNMLLFFRQSWWQFGNQIQVQRLRFDIHRKMVC